MTREIDGSLIELEGELAGADFAMVGRLDEDVNSEVDMLEEFLLLIQAVREWRNYVLNHHVFTSPPESHISNEVLELTESND